MHITNKLTIKIVITCIAILFIAFCPIIILQAIGKIHIYYSYGWYYYGVDDSNAIYEATILIKFIRDYWEYGNILVALILNIALAVKLFIVNRQSPEGWTKQKATIERLFLLQNFANAFIFIAYFITYFTFVFLCHGYSSDCMSNFPQRFVVMFYSSNAARVIWRPCLKQGSSVSDSTQTH
uniref:7TM GPCR serpentine receptor class x (Srx) domain-containing protein n=1 Tax=Acrobeloides nanus TaxID=290746 RepID=A0A914CE79_9BILA